MITNEDYFSYENNLKYMGSSQFKSFLNCEAKTLAELNGIFERQITPALLVGSYVDAHFSKELDVFKAKNVAIFTKQGELKSEYKQADYIINRIERDKMFMKYMSGQTQIIKTGKIAGVPFKIKMDSYHPKKCIVDMKIMKDFEPIWVEEQGKLSFIEAWGYDIQAAIYQKIEGNNLPFYIAAATKEKEPDIGIFFLPQDYLDLALEKVEAMAPRFQAIKNGDIEPTRCEHCDYCKQTKVLTNIISLGDL